MAGSLIREALDEPLVMFLDCEFTDFIQIDLISIGLVSEDGREFYAVRSDFARQDCSDFVRVAVLPLLESAPSMPMSREALVLRLRDWLAALPAFVIAWDSNHDWDLFADALDGQPVANLKGWINLNALPVQRGAAFQRETARYHDLPDHPWHHALHDARAHRAGWLAAQAAQVNPLDEEKTP